MKDKPVGFQWLREQGHGGLITETVNASTLAAFAKNMMDTEGKELPHENLPRASILHQHHKGMNMANDIAQTKALSCISAGQG